MCRDTISVDWEGRVYDCDFNQQLGLQQKIQGQALYVWQLDEDSWLEQSIRLGQHCYGCTAVRAPAAGAPPHKNAKAGDHQDLGTDRAAVGCKQRSCQRRAPRDCCNSMSTAMGWIMPAGRQTQPIAKISTKWSAGWASCQRMPVPPSRRRT